MTAPAGADPTQAAEARGGGAVERWRALPAPLRVVAAVAAVLVALAALRAVVESLLGGTTPGGPTSSSYATGSDGLAAYADLLAQAGHDVGRLRTSLDESALAGGWTVVVIDPDLLRPAEVAALRRFLAVGGRLVAGGESSASGLRRLLPAGPAWAPGGTATAHPVVPVPEDGGVRRTSGAGTGSWRDSGAALPVLASGGRVVAAVAQVGPGRTVLLADPSMLQNHWLGRGDNAAFGLAVAGPSSRPVRFAEAAHGYGQAAAGLGAIPRPWRTGAAVGVVAIIVWLWSRGRRLGPPEDAQRALPPPRRAYVDAVAASVMRTKDRTVALHELRTLVRADLARQTGLAGPLDDGAARAAAERAALSDEEVSAVAGAVHTDEEVLALGRAVARIRSGR